MNLIYDNLLRSNKVNITSPKSYDLCPPDMSDKSNEPEPKRSKRFASTVALKKNKSNKLYVICLLGINIVYFLLMSFSFTADDEHCICVRNIQLKILYLFTVD